MYSDSFRSPAATASSYGARHQSQYFRGNSSGGGGPPGTDERAPEPLLSPDASSSPYPGIPRQASYHSPSRATFRDPYSAGRDAYGGGLGSGGRYGGTPYGSGGGGGAGLGGGPMSPYPPAAAVGGAGGVMHHPLPSPSGYPYGPLGPPSPTRAYVRPRHGAVEPPRGLTSRKGRQQQQASAQNDLRIDSSMDGLGLSSVGRQLSARGGGGHLGGSSSGMPPLSPQRGYSAGSAYGGGGGVDLDAPPIESLMDLDDHDANRNSRVHGEQTIVLREPEADDPSRWGGHIGQQAWASWVVVFGFPKELREAVKSQFALYGAVQETASDGNWVLIKYATRPQAEKAVAQNGTLLRTTLPQDQVLLAVVRVTPDIVRKLGVALNPQGAIHIVRKDERPGSFLLGQQKDRLRQRTFRPLDHRGDSETLGREGRTYTVNDTDLLKPVTRRRNLIHQIWMFICSIFNWH